MNVKAVADQVVKAGSGLRPSSDAAGAFYRYSRLNDLLALTKPRVMMLSVFTAIVGLLSAPGRVPSQFSRSEMPSGAPMSMRMQH